MNQRLPIFDWIRSIAIVMILLHHLPNYTFNYYDLNYFGIPIDLSNFNELNRFLGLSLFVFSSGYLINVNKVSFSTKDAIYSFIKQRVLRIYPLYYIAVACFCLIEKVYNPIKILIHLLGLQLMFRMPEHFIPIRTLWFVSLITIYYFIFALLKYDRLSKSIRFGALTLILLIFLILEGGFRLTDYRLSLYYLTFIFGIICAETELPNFQIWKYMSYVFAMVFTFMAIYLPPRYEALITPGNGFLLRYLLLNILMISFVVTAYNICQWLSARLKFESTFETVAYSSYCMYLFHRPIFHVIREGTIAKMSITDPYYLLAPLLLIGLPIIFVFSYGVQTAYDKYFRGYFLAL